MQKPCLREAGALRAALEAAEPLPESLAALARDLGFHETLIARLDRALRDELPLLARDGGFIRAGYAPELDELASLRAAGRVAHAEHDVVQAGLEQAKQVLTGHAGARGSGVNCGASSAFSRGLGISKPGKTSWRICLLISFSILLMSINALP